MDLEEYRLQKEEHVQQLKRARLHEMSYDERYSLWEAIYKSEQAVMREIEDPLVEEMKRLFAKIETAHPSRQQGYRIGPLDIVEIAREQWAAQGKDLWT